MNNRKINKIVGWVNRYVHGKIHACNIPGAKKQNKFFAPLVLVCQNQCDAILANDDNSLNKILQCAKTVDNYGAGNCLLQVFLAFDYLMKSFILAGLSTYDHCVPISIYTTSNHAFLMINNQIISDTWLGVDYDSDNSPYSNVKVNEYFGIRSNWDCYTNTTTPDKDSTTFTYLMVEQLMKTLPTGSFFVDHCDELAAMNTARFIDVNDHETMGVNTKNTPYQFYKM